MILQINFTLNIPATEYAELSKAAAQPISEVHGLIWKIWLINDNMHEAGGIYHFDSQASLEAYLNGPLVAMMKTMPIVRDIAVKQFDVIPDLTSTTRGPV